MPESVRIELRKNELFLLHALTELRVPDGDLKKRRLEVDGITVEVTRYGHWFSVAALEPNDLIMTIDGSDRKLSWVELNSVSANNDLAVIGYGEPGADHCHYLAI